MRLKSRPATRADILAFFERPSDRTIRARALEIDGEVVGVAGYYMAGGVAVVFSDSKGDIPKAVIWRESKAMMSSLKVPAVCIATPGSERFLERLGWVHAGPSADGEVYQWPV